MYKSHHPYSRHYRENNAGKTLPVKNDLPVPGEASSQQAESESERRPLPLLERPAQIAQGSRDIVTLEVDACGELYADGLRSYRLARATSCLVQPLGGDRVCIIFDGSTLVITEILSRRQESVPITLDSRGAGLRIVAPEVELHGIERLKLQSPNFTLLTRSGRWIADTLHQITNRLFVRSEHANRKVEQTDEVQARHIVQDAEQSFVVKSEIGSLKSSAVLKIDGGQVHVG